MFVLNEAQRLAILSGCVGLLFTVIVLTVCFACPFCWFYKLINNRKLKADAEMNFIRSYFPGNFVGNEPPPPYEMATKESYFDMQSLYYGRRMMPVNSVPASCTDSDSVTGIPLNSDSDIPSTDIREKFPFQPGNVSITLQFKRITGEDKKVYSQLRIDMKEASDLPLRAYGGQSDPYFRISIYDKNVIKKKKKNPALPPIYEFQTTVAKKSQHPIYNESFFYPLESNQLKKCYVKIEAWDKDKWANDTALGEVYFNLKGASSFLLQEPQKELDLNLKLEDSKRINGQILLGLSYLPTAERMTAVIFKANNLKAVGGEKCDTSEFYVKAMTIYQGKIFERRKTCSCQSTSTPAFNEMLMFDVPFSKLDEVFLMITVWVTNKEALTKNSQQKTAKDTCIGKTIIGSYSQKKILNHWRAMRISPRQQVRQWHDLN